jgi:hypothetical protein
MSEFIKIGEAANMFNTLGSAVTQGTGTTITPTPSSGKKSGNGLAIVAGIVIVGIIGYELYLYFEKEKVDESNKI